MDRTRDQLHLLSPGRIPLPARTRGPGLLVLLALIAAGVSGCQRQGRPPHPTPSVTTRASPTPAATGQGWIAAENRKPGTAAWRIIDPKATAGIEGYADHVSARAGDQVRLFVSTPSRSFHVEAYRMGFYQGLGARLVWQSGEANGGKQVAQFIDPATRMIEARWAPSIVVPVGQDWPPGDYLLKLVGDAGGQHYVPLAIRDDGSHAALVIQNSVTTWQAYNLWGGRSLYEGPGKFPDRSRVVSFDRPYRNDGSGDFLGNEYPMVRFAESLGLDVTYWTDVDLHERPELLANHRALISLGHDEYWSTSMRRGVEQARDRGVNLAFLGANAMYRHIRFESSPLGPDRHQVDYKVAKEDPLFGQDNKEVTSNWPDPPLNEPESAVIGDQYKCNFVHNDAVISDDHAWVFEGTGLKNGDHLPGIVGTEYDGVVPGPPTPSNIEVLAHSPLVCKGNDFSDMTYYSAASGAGVFATGTNLWVCELTAGCLQNQRPAPLQALLRTTQNVLEEFSKGPAGEAHPSHSNLAALGIKK